MGNMGPQALSSSLSLSVHEMNMFSPTYASHGGMLPRHGPQGQPTMEWKCPGCCQNKPVFGVGETAR